MAWNQCSCRVSTNDWAALFTPNGTPVHVHGDGRVESGGESGAIDIGNAKWHAKKLIAEHGWLARGWRP